MIKDTASYLYRSKMRKTFAGIYHLDSYLDWGIDINMKDSHTIGMKTAISIPDDIFEEVNKIAREYNYSRSHVICTAVKEYLEKMRSRKLLEDLNKTYKDGDTQEETLLRKESVEYYAKTILKHDDDDQTR